MNQVVRWPSNGVEGLLIKLRALPTRERTPVAEEITEIVKHILTINPENQEFKEQLHRVLDKTVGRLRSEELREEVLRIVKRQQTNTLINQFLRPLLELTEPR